MVSHLEEVCAGGRDDVNAVVRRLKLVEALLNRPHLLLALVAVAVIVNDDGGGSGGCK